MHLIAESEAKVVYKEPIFVDQFLILFIREARKEDNTTSECVRTVGATYVCKILQLYKYVANEGTDTKQTASHTRRMPVYAA